VIQASSAATAWQPSQAILARLARELDVMANIGRGVGDHRFRARQISSAGHFLAQAAGTNE
jgi:hypothetical protein